MRVQNGQCAWLPGQCSIPVAAYAHLLCDMTQCGDGVTVVVFYKPSFLNPHIHGKFYMKGHLRCEGSGSL